MKLLILIILVTASFSCGRNSRTANVDVAGIKPDVITIMDGAMKAVEDRSEGPFMHATPAEADMQIRVAFGDAGYQDGFKRWGYAHAVEGECHILLSNDANFKSPMSSSQEALLAILTLHEIGHCFGLGHSTEPTDIMYPYLNQNAQSGIKSLERYVAAIAKARGI